MTNNEIKTDWKQQYDEQEHNSKQEGQFISESKAKGVAQMVETAEGEVCNVPFKCHLEEYWSKEIVSSEYCTYFLFIKGHKNPIENKTHEDITRDGE